MANIKLSDLIKQINEEFAPPGGWRASDKIKKRKSTSSQALKRASGRVGPRASKHTTYTRITQRGSWRAPKLKKGASLIRLVELNSNHPGPGAAYLCGLQADRGSRMIHKVLRNAGSLPRLVQPR